MLYACRGEDLQPVQEQPNLNEDELDGAEHHNPGRQPKGSLTVASSILLTRDAPEVVQGAASCHPARAV